MAGRNFTPLPDSAVESEVIVNEEVLKRFKIANGDPVKALDEILLVDRKPMKIIGVMKDFHYGKADNNDKEVVLRYVKSKANFLNVKVSSTDWLTTLAKMEAAWRKIDNVHPMDAQLYSERIAHSFREMSAMLNMIGFLAFLAICIASMGMLGMVIFMTETRLKEISIRKVLGASEGKLIYLLGRGFILLLGVAGGIALPLTYFFFEQVAFLEMGNHAPIGVTDMLVGFTAVMAIAFLMIGSQTLKITRTNPAQVLKNE
jgi:putative ABC transport system permease protein